jgi:transposase
MPDADTDALWRQVARRGQLVRHKTRLKNEVQSVLHAHLILRCPFTDLFGKKGRAWLAEQPWAAIGGAYEYSLAAVRASECAASEQAERAYDVPTTERVEEAIAPAK